MTKNLKTGVVLSNLGTPNAATKKAVRAFLAEFLSDRRVVDYAKVLWLPLLYGVILTLRPKNVAKEYAKVWNKMGAGSPLLTITEQQKKALEQRLGTNNTHFAIGMRYGNPSLEQGIEELLSKDCEKIILLPLYPQYFSASVGSTIQKTLEIIKDRRIIPEITTINSYYNFLPYIKALATSIKEHQKKHGLPDKLIISFHGIPKRYTEMGDPYYDQCVKTTELIVDELKLKNDEYEMTFQSIFGKEQWLQPYTSNTLKTLGQQGVSNVQVICPGFSADCLETIVEIEEENRGYFMDAGGGTFSYIPALNCRDGYIEALYQLIKPLI